VKRFRKLCEDAGIPDEIRRRQFFRSKRHLRREQLLRARRARNV
jgi:ribosomal protein S21